VGDVKELRAVPYGFGTAVACYTLVYAAPEGLIEITAPDTATLRARYE
jgi:hypothetical protein